MVHSQMSREEAQKIIEIARAEVEWEYPMDYSVAFDVALAALQQPEDMVSREEYEKVVAERDEALAKLQDLEHII